MKFSVTVTVLIIYGIDILFASISVFYALGDRNVALLLLGILVILLIILVMFTDILIEHKKK